MSQSDRDIPVPKVSPEVAMIEVSQLGASASGAALAEEKARIETLDPMVMAEFPPESTKPTSALSMARDSSAMTWDPQGKRRDPGDGES